MNYTKEKRVGEGTFAVVYLGKQVETNRNVAVKMIKTSAFKDGLDVTALREIKFLQEMKHINVIELLDVFTSEGGINLVLEFLPGDLEILIKDRSVVFAESDVKAWMLMMIRGVYHCHRNFILHRDLKPSNMLLAPNGQLKIADFGLARAMTLTPLEKMTPTVVTRWYRAPELLMGARHYSGAVDVWSLGIIFAELMLRVPYLAGQNDLDQLDVTFKALGTPTPAIWPGCNLLPGYPGPNSPKYAPPTRLQMQGLFSAASDSALELMESMIQMDPLKRVDTAQALMSPYFTRHPLPTRATDLPSQQPK